NTPCRIEKQLVAVGDTAIPEGEEKDATVLVSERLRSNSVDDDTASIDEAKSLGPSDAVPVECGIGKRGEVGAVLERPDGSAVTVRVLLFALSGERFVLSADFRRAFELDEGGRAVRVEDHAFQLSRDFDSVAT